MSESIKLYLTERIIIGQLESVGNFDEQMKQLDLRDKCKVTKEYLKQVEAKTTVNGEQVDTTPEIMLQGVNFNPSKDDFTLDITDSDKAIFVNWIHLTCRKLPNPPSTLVELYRRIQ